MSKEILSRDLDEMNKREMSSDLYFIDFEFNGEKGDPITLGVKASDGRSAYWGFRDFLTKVDEAELKQVDIIDPWVRENVFPVIAKGDVEPRWLTTVEIQKELKEFLTCDTDGTKEPLVVSDWPSDVELFSRLLITGPGTMIDIDSITFKIIRVDAWPNDMDRPEKAQHNAMWDARALEHLYHLQQAASEN